MKEKFCLYCGAALPQSAKFCSSCGNLQEEQVTGAAAAPVAEAAESAPVVADIVLEAPEETTPAPVVEAAPAAVAVAVPPAEEPASAPTAPAKKKRNLGWLQSALLLLLATAMLVMAFLPVAKLDIGGYEDDFEGMKLAFRPLDFIVFAFDSFRNLDEDELADSSVYEKLQEKSEELNEAIEDYEENEVDTYNDLSSADQKIFEKVMYLMIRVVYQSEESNYSAIFYVMAVMALLYLLLCAVSFVLALLNLLSSLKLLPFGKKLNRAAVSAFCATPGLVLALYYAIFATYEGAINVIMCSPAIIALILSGVGVAVLATVAFFKAPKGERKVPVLRIVSACFAILLVCMLYVPVMSAHVKTVFDEREKKTEVTLPMDIAFFDQLKSDFEEDYYYYDFFEDASREEAKTQVESLFNRFSYYTVREVKDGVADSANGDVVVGALAAGKVLSVCGFFAQTSLFYLLVMIGAALLLWQNLCYFAGGKTSNGCVLAGKIISVIAAALSLAVVVAFVVILHLCVEKYAPDGYRIFFTAGSVLTLVAAIAACVCPVGNKKQNKIK